MKGSILAAAAAFAGGVSASRINHRHAAAHELFEKRGAADEICTTVVNTIYGEMSMSFFSFFSFILLFPL